MLFTPMFHRQYGVNGVPIIFKVTKNTTALLYCISFAHTKSIVTKANLLESS